MDTKTKKTLLIGTIIILLVINITALLTIIYNNKVRTKKLEQISSIQEEMREQGMRRFFQQELKLTEDQVDKFQDVHTKYSNDSRKIADELRDKRHEMMIEIANKNPNYKKLDNIAEDIGMLHYELKKLTISHFIELKEICNEEQQEILNKMFFKMLSSQDGERMDRGHRGRENDDKPRRRNRHRNNN